MKTIATPKAKITRAWHQIDCSGQTLGRIATRIAGLLIGKAKVDFTSNQDMGDYVVVVNAGKIKVTGNKLLAKSYSRHSGFPGGYREVSLERQLARDPRRVIEHAVRGMLPKNKLQADRLRRLKIYPTETHPHTNHFPTKEA